MATPMWVLIPSYEPDRRLLEIVAALRRDLPAAGILVVDDGSGPAYQHTFDGAARLGASVLHHGANRGKAAALRTGMEWLALMAPDGVIVCADSDGQHRPADIARVAREVTARVEGGDEQVLVLGTRAFDGEVPLRSRVGNRISTAMVHLASGHRIADTQTGLRGFSAHLIPWLLHVPGERFAYELRMLLEAGRHDLSIVEVPIETVYLEENASSHFRPVIDSLQVMAPLLLFAASSLIAAGVDLVGVLVLNALTGSLPLAVVGARVVSAGVNFTLNRRAVFDAKGPLGRQVLGYLALAAALLAGSYLGILLLVDVGFPLVVAKVVTDVGLWLVSYLVQRRLVFSGRGAQAGGGAGAAGRSSSSSRVSYTS